MTDDIDVTFDDEEEEPTLPSGRFIHLQPLHVRAPKKPTLGERENVLLSWTMVGIFVCAVILFAILR